MPLRTPRRKTTRLAGSRFSHGVFLTLHRLFAATVLIALVPVAAARAQGVEGTRSATIFVGTGLSLAGNAINEGVGTIDGKPSVLVEQALSNHFSDALRLRFTGSLGLDYNKEAFVDAGLRQVQRHRADRRIGVRLSAPGPIVQYRRLRHRRRPPLLPAARGSDSHLRGRGRRPAFSCRRRTPPSGSSRWG